MGTRCVNASPHSSSLVTCAGDLDEAVQALKATTEGADDCNHGPDSRLGGVNDLLDDDLKPSFMRHMAADHRGSMIEDVVQRSIGTKQKRTADSTSRPAIRRRTDYRTQASARDVLQARSLQHDTRANLDHLNSLHVLTNGTNIVLVPDSGLMLIMSLVLAVAIAWVAFNLQCWTNAEQLLHLVEHVRWNVWHLRPCHQ